jgi:hypothetical protein
MQDYIEAEYTSGYVHRQTVEDHSPYVVNMNIFNDILNHRPVEAHGRMTRFSLVTAEETFSVDWTVLPDNARPIYLKHMEGDFADGGVVETRVVKQEFGAQWNDVDGKNHKIIEEII